MAVSDMAVSDRARAVAQALADTCGASPTIDAYRDEAGRHRIDIARVPDCPGPGLVTAGTIMLSDHDLGPEAEGVGIELIAAYPASAADFPAMLAASALAVIMQGWPLRRGAVHTDLAERHGVSVRLPHLLFVPPLLWAGQPAPIVRGGGTIGWLMAVPISEPEREYAARHGAAALEVLLFEADIDVADLERPSATPRRG